jgi:hypothetical protein
MELVMDCGTDMLLRADPGARCLMMEPMRSAAIVYVMDVN